MKRSSWVVLILIYGAMVLAAVVSRQTFDRLPHLEDEFAYLYQARLFERGDVSLDIEEPRRAYWQPFLISLDGNRFSKYPPGWSLLLAMGTGLNLPWVINMWFAGLTVGLVYRLGRTLYDTSAGVVAALLMTISPIAILMNATLMSHTSTLFFVMLFIYALWCMEQGKQPLRWAALGGAALGIVIASRPLVSVAVAAPFIIYSGLRLGWVLLRDWRQTWATLWPLLVFSAVTLLLGGLFPLYNYLVSGNPTENLYTYIWSYDRVGFGEGHGRYSGTEFLSVQYQGQKINMRTHEGHNPERGWRTTKTDTACYARDLFGWVGANDAPPREITRGNECLADQRGYSWILLPFSALFVLGVAYRQAGGLRPLALMKHILVESRWTVLLLALATAVIGVHIAYWIGAGVYSSRYYFEATAALAIVSGAGVSGLARLVRRVRLHYLVYLGVIGLAWLSLTGYTPHRLAPLEGYGRITDDLAQQVNLKRQSPDTPVMVIAYGDHHWRDIAPLMGLTDPYLEHDIIALRDTGTTYTPGLLERFPDREAMFIIDNQLITWQQFLAGNYTLPQD